MSAHQEPLDVGERTVSDAYSLPFAEIRIREDRKIGANQPLNGVDLRIWDGVEPVPRFAEHPHHPARLADLQVGQLVDGVAHEKISSEQRNASTHPNPSPSRPRVGGRKEQVESLRRELVVDELLAIAARPENAPAWDPEALSDFRQGFAPFGFPHSHECRHQSKPSVTQPGIRPRVLTSATTVTLVRDVTRRSWSVSRVICC